MKTKEYFKMEILTRKKHMTMHFKGLKMNLSIEENFRKSLSNNMKYVSKKTLMKSQENNNKEFKNSNSLELVLSSRWVKT